MVELLISGIFALCAFAWAGEGTGSTGGTVVVGPINNSSSSTIVIVAPSNSNSIEVVACPVTADGKPQIDNGVYKLCNSTDLLWFAEQVNAGNNEINGKLLNDIDLLNESWTPIGTSDNPFKGVFDGQGHVVTNLHVETTGDYAGFFGYILNEGDDESNGVVKNVGIENSDIKGTKYVGGVVAYNGGDVSSVYNAGSVTGSGSGCFTGGVVGYNGGFIAEVYNAGPVESTANDCSTGGVVGRNEKFVYYSYNIGTVGGGANVGGVAGSNNGSIFKAYYNTESFAGNAVGSGKQPEPAAGKTPAELSSLEIVDLCSDEYHVEQSAWEVGFGRVVMSDNKLVYKLPGLKGFSSQSEIVLMQADNQGVFEIGSAQELKWFAEFASIEKIISISAKLTADICLNACNEGTSVLDAEGALNGDGSNFEQWTPINIAYGATNVSLDGNGHTISGLYFRNADRENVGFFGKLQGTVSISNLGIVDSYFEGKDSVGVFVGTNDNSNLTITNCFGAGYVKGNDYVAGFIGCTKGGLNIANSYSVSIVNGENYTASFIGNNALGTIANCFFLNGSSNFGGLQKTAAEFHDGTVAMLLHNWCEKEKSSENCKESGLNGSIWGQDVTKENSLPNFNDKILSNKRNSIVFFYGEGGKIDSAHVDAASDIAVDFPSDVVVSGPIKFKRPFASTGYSTITLPFTPNCSNDNCIKGGRFCDFTSFANNTVFVKKINQKDLQANTPYLISTTGVSELVIKNGGTFKANKGKTYNSTTKTVKKILNNEWAIYGTYKFKKWNKDDDDLGLVYGFAGAKENNINVGQFVRAGAGASIQPMRAYLKYEKASSAGIRATNKAKAIESTQAALPETINIAIVDNTLDNKTKTTLIGTINTRTGELHFESSRWFDLNGRFLGNKKTTHQNAYYNNGKKVLVK